MGSDDVIPLEQVGERGRQLLREGRDADAFELFLGAARAGARDAQMILGWLYDVGRGCAADVAEAETWYRAAADQDDAWAMFYLAGLLHRRGDLDGTHEWYRRAAALDFAPALYWLAYFEAYRTGDPEQKRALFQRARELGHVPAAVRLARLQLREARGLRARLRAVAEILRCIRLIVLVVGEKADDEVDPRLLF